MRIGIDIRKYYDYGIGTYIQNLLAGCNGRVDHQFTYFAPTELSRTLAHLYRGTFITENSSKYSVNELLTLSGKANSSSLDLFHSPHYTVPIRLKMPVVVTIHDIIHIRLKQFYSFAQRSYAYGMIRHACRVAAAVIVDSDFGKNELLELFPWVAPKLHVVHLGVNSLYFESIDDNKRKDILNKLSIEKPYILYTGSLKPHKNVPILLNALHAVRRESDVELVIAGESLARYPSLRAQIEMLHLSKFVHNPGRLSQEELHAVYRSAEAVILPSIYEGFGFSMLEAMASGVPAIGANSASIPEVVGDAGLIFQSSDSTDLAEKIQRVLGSSAYRSNLVHKGLQRAREFSWEKCVQKTFHLYQETVK